ncbi:DUF6603 domain-containing protein [Cupriavidus gilardii]|uniref:DUF6603 domain-containing protein n=1 Tax=Cupriavidus gilardii TaxID=82541 RepID=UPI001580F31D|nr:DUF6603 domain-containing protein [Cupriavidus gilardii]MCT9073573.1 hypothetical protein [Cupriavidus gilardii]QKS61423.1 hypothetical protein FOB47_05955 [Cupriavidus gilardii]
MASSEVIRYAVELGDSLRRTLGPAAPSADLDALQAAAQQLDAFAQQAPSASDWTAAVDAWTAARNRLAAHLNRYLLEGLPDIPGLQDLVRALNWDSPHGLNGELPLGPLKLALSSSALVLQPRLPDGTTLPPFSAGPRQPSGIAVSLPSPFGGGLPGGGAIVRLPSGTGFGGALNVPLGAVSVSASAVLERLPDGVPSFLALMGVSFVPPIQLSFGFSLDRVGGLVGVHRRADTDALAVAVRSGAAADTLLATRPPANPSLAIEALQRFFPAFRGSHLVAPTLRLAWLSAGAGSFLSLDLGLVAEVPSGKVVLLGVARAGIPGVPGLVQLRLDLLGIVDPAQALISLDASLVDSHVLGVFSVYGDAAMRLHWGSQAYAVVSIGGFYPGFNPEPAQLPALRRVGLSMQTLGGPLSIRAEGYLAFTTNTIQLGGRFDITFSMGLTAHGFLQIDALVQFRPFAFVANASAGFEVRAGGFSFGGVRLDGTVSGPGPLVIRGRLTIETFLFDVSWDETFSLGSGPADMAASPGELLTILQQEIVRAGNVRAASIDDPAVVLAPRPTRPGIAAVPPTGALQWSQRRAPLGLPIDRVDGLPLPARGGARVLTPGEPVLERFAPGHYCNLNEAEQLNRPPFDVLDAGVVLSGGPPHDSAAQNDDRKVDLVVILPGLEYKKIAQRTDLRAIAHLVAASHRPPALGNTAQLIHAAREVWTTVPPTEFASYTSATAAHAFARHNSTGGAVPIADLLSPVNLSGV